jgi:[CysO sulfur-carrier protein]-S-L-cysteine hydrolase
MPSELHLTDDLLIQINQYAADCQPLESCGLLAGKGSQATNFLPITNELKSSYAFRMNAQEQLDAFLWMDAHKLELLALFHSHPGGLQTPSATDLAESAYPGTPMLIWTPASLRVFLLSTENFEEIHLIVEKV